MLKIGPQDNFRPSLKIPNDEFDFQVETTSQRRSDDSSKLSHSKNLIGGFVPSPYFPSSRKRLGKSLELPSPPRWDHGKWKPVYENSLL